MRLIANPLAGIVTDDVGVLVPLGAELGEYLVREAVNALQAPVMAYGKAAIVGTSGDIEHAAAIIHPPHGKAHAGGYWGRSGDYSL